MAVLHQQPDIVPWTLGLTRSALAALAQLYDEPHLVEESYFDDWVGNHIANVEPASASLFHGLQEEVEPGLWRDGWGVVWDVRGLYGEGEWGRPMNCVLPQPTLAGFRLPDPPAPQAYAHYPAAIRAKQDCFIIGSEGHLFELAWALRGIEDFLVDMVQNPGFVDELFDAITEHYLAMIDESARYPIDAFAFGEDWGAERGLIMGPALWRRFIKPRMARMFARVKQAGKLTWMHSDGDITAILPDLIEIGLDIYNPFQPDVMDVYAIKKQCGDRLCFHGGVSIQELLPHGTPEQVRAEAQRLIREVGAGGGYILAPSHAVLGDTPVENIVALIEVVRGQ
jgi:uroporphyrinogen decarboxylase